MKCEIIQDLLPNYIDGLTSPVTNQEIENHLNECRKCRELFQDMNETVDVSSTSSRSIDPFLKIKESQLRKIILAVFITIAIVYFLNIAIKFLISCVKFLYRLCQMTNICGKTVPKQTKYRVPIK